MSSDLKKNSQKTGRNRKNSDRRNSDRRKRNGHKIKKENHKKNIYINNVRIRIIVIIGCSIVLLLSIIGLLLQYLPYLNKETSYYHPDPNFEDGRPYIDVQLLTPNEYSRPCIPTEKMTGIVIHYVGNPGSTAQGNRDYFENLKDTEETYASSNFIVGLEGEIIQCIPTNEIAYCSNERNINTVSIEVCHETEDGKFNESTYASLVNLTGWLCMYLDVSPKDVIRHYDVTGKICPKYYVENEDAWETFIEDVKIWVYSEKRRES